MPKPHLIAIAGPSGSGKTTLARALQALSPQQVALLSLDRYYHDLSHLTITQRQTINFDAPTAIDFHHLLADLHTLITGTSINLPLYDFNTHTRTVQSSRFSARKFLIIEGIFALYWQALRTLCATKIFITAPDQLCLERRLQRDVNQRDRSPTSVRNQYIQSVRPMYAQHIYPTQHYADLLLAGDDPPEISTNIVIKYLAKPFA